MNKLKKIYRLHARLKNYLIFFILIFFFCSYSAPNAKMDIFTEYSISTPYLEKVSTQINSSRQIKKESIYRVTGIHASEIEKLLHKKYGLPDLQYKCCSWETRSQYDNFKKTERIKNSYFYYSIKMYSDETTITDKKDWDKIPFFYIVARVIEI